MKLKASLWGLGIATLATLPSLSAQAASIDLQVFPSLDAHPSKCPERVKVMETSQPYREGSYTLDGFANLKNIAGNFSIATKDAFSVTWVAQLKPPYRQCKATGGMAQREGSEYQSHSYLRLRFVGGKVYLILDMTGKNDINNFTPAIVKQGVKDGNPFWSWSGSD